MNDLAIIDDPFIQKEERLYALERHLEKAGSQLRVGKPKSEIDLHLHTNHSDGYWTPTGLVFEAYQSGMKLIALTDHDCFTGIEEAFAAIDIIKETIGTAIGFVPGIELSTTYCCDASRKKKDIHILGYFPSPSFKHFEDHLEKLDARTKVYMEALHKNRTLRIYEMVNVFNQQLPAKVPLLARLRKAQDPIISDKTVERGLRNSISPGRLLSSTGIFFIYDLHKRGKLHEIKDENFSKEYLEMLHELCSGFTSARDFMKEYFDKKEPSAKTDYIGLTKDPAWAVQTILQMGGIPVLAHPAKYLDLLGALLSLLAPTGLRGVEIFSDHFKDKKPLGRTLDFLRNGHPELVITIGSDCHGSSIDKEINYSPENIMGLRTDHGIRLRPYFDRIDDLLFHSKPYQHESMR